MKNGLGSLTASIVDQLAATILVRAGRAAGVS